MRGKMRDTLIGGLTALLLSPLTIFVGYELNNYLTKNKITIEDVQLRARALRMPYPRKLLRQLDKGSINALFFQNYLDNHCTIDAREKEQLFSRDFWRDDRLQFVKEDFTKGKADALFLVLNGFLDYLSEVEKSDQELIKRIEGSKAGEKLEGYCKGYRI